MMEFPITPSPLRNALVIGAPAMREGYVVVPEEPGLGVSLDPAVVERFRVAGP
jgi:L-alanine-DL-glutamate epimerase-like enolase superfamily enzyme